MWPLENKSILIYYQLLLSLPGHFLLLTRHSLNSDTSAQGLPKGDGCWSTCRVRVSWPRLNPQVLPDREQGLHSLHSPTSQCTDGGGKEGDGEVRVSRFFFFFAIMLVFFTPRWTDLVVCTP